MASRAQYTLKIAGRLKEDIAPTALNKIKGDLKDIFKSVSSGAGTGAFSDELGDELGDEWPKGFVLKNYKVCQWELKLDKPHKPEHPDDKKKYKDFSEEVMVTFRAEVHHTRDGSLFMNRLYMLPEVNWFYHYRKYLWHKQLTEKLAKFNEEYKSHLIEKVWFRDWQWYCGNGGC
jgi:hypothetical protein